MLEGGGGVEPEAERHEHPEPEQRREAMAKRRIGLGFLGLGSALVMLGIRYDSEQGLAFGAAVAQAMRDERRWAVLRGLPAYEAAASLYDGLRDIETVLTPDQLADIDGRMGLRGVG